MKGDKNNELTIRLVKRFGYSRYCCVQESNYFEDLIRMWQYEQSLLNIFKWFDEGDLYIDAIYVFQLTTKTVVFLVSVISHNFPTCVLRVTHICISRLTIIGSGSGLSPERHQAIIWMNAGILLIGPWATKLTEILIEIQIFLLEKCIEFVVWEVASILYRPQCVNCFRAGSFVKKTSKILLVFGDVLKCIPFLTLPLPRD